MRVLVVLRVLGLFSDEESSNKQQVLRYAQEDNSGKIGSGKIGFSGYNLCVAMTESDASPDRSVTKSTVE